MGASKPELRHHGSSIRRTTLSRILSFITLAIIFSFFFTTATAWTCDASSRQALLAFKAGLVDKMNMFSSWNDNSDCCSWQYVSCNVYGAVTGLSITGSSSSNQQDYRNTSYNTDVLGATLVALPSLQTLKIQWVLFNGPIPSNWGAFPSSLVSIILNDCDLQGWIPSSMSKIANLQHLDLSNNHLTGTIPDSFCTMYHLIYLDVSYNDMPGSIVPSCLQNVNGLTLKVGNQGQSSSPGPNSEAPPLSTFSTSLNVLIIVAISIFFSM